MLRFGTQLIGQVVVTSNLTTINLPQGVKYVVLFKKFLKLG